MKALELDKEMEFQQFGGLTDRAFAALRVTLAAGSLLIIYLDPAEPDRYVHVTYYMLLAYLGYSIAVYVFARRRINFSQKIMQGVLWLDIACYSFLISLSSGTNNLFSFFYLFAIIVASSRGGLKLGVWATVVSVVLFALADFSINPPADLNNFLIRRLAMTVLGCILAYWGGAELELKRRLALLKQLTFTANPRFGVDRTIGHALQRILEFCDAQYCLLILSTETGTELYRADRSDEKHSKSRLEGPAHAWLLETPDHRFAVFNRQRRPWPRPLRYRSYGSSGEVEHLPQHTGEMIADMLGARAFVSVPLRFGDHFKGRLVVASEKPDAFDANTAAFLAQVTNQVLPIIDNIRLVDRMASDASEEERRRIARSVHDRVIQPYFGLQIGLKALKQLLQDDGKHKPVVLLEQLTAMTSEGIDELRRYIFGLRESSSTESRLVDSIRRFAERFERATGIRVDVIDESPDLAANDRLIAEVFQMAAEGLSNVHRHTDSRNAQIRLGVLEDSLILRIENEVKEGFCLPFQPTSLCERSEALGGRTEVQCPQGRTVVRVEVPL